MDEAAASASSETNAARRMNALEWAAQRMLREAFGAMARHTRITVQATPRLWADRRFVAQMTLAAACRWAITTEDMVRLFRLVKRYRAWIVPRILEAREGPRERLARLRADPTISRLDPLG